MSETNLIGPTKFEMYRESLRMLENMIFCIDIPTIGVIRGRGTQETDENQRTFSGRTLIYFPSAIRNVPNGLRSNELVHIMYDLCPFVLRTCFEGLNYQFH